MLGLGPLGGCGSTAARGSPIPVVQGGAARPQRAGTRLGVTGEAQASAHPPFNGAITWNSRWTAGGCCSTAAARLRGTRAEAPSSAASRAGAARRRPSWPGSARGGRPRSCAPASSWTPKTWTSVASWALFGDNVDNYSLLSSGLSKKLNFFSPHIIKTIETQETKV